LDPPKIRVTGRIKHYTSAFGEHVIGEEVDDVMSKAVERFNLRVNEFHLAPQVTPKEGLPYHEWFVEWEEQPNNLEDIAQYMDDLMVSKNSYYRDNIKGGVMRRLVITSVARGGFAEYMRSQGKLGGQNKIPRLANDRKIADFLG
jgi:hypothetical protein